MSTIKERTRWVPLARALTVGIGLMLASTAPASADHGTFALRVTIMACEDAGSVVVGDGLTTNQCPPVLLPADDPGPPPADHTWLHEPILADTQLEIDDGETVFTRQDMVFGGEVVCLDDPKVCWVPASYDLAAEIVAGTVTVRQLTFPDGYGPGTAYLHGGDVPVPMVIADDGSVTFDTTGADFRHVVFANDALAPPPAPTARPTTPATSTLEIGGHPDHGDAPHTVDFVALGVLVTIVWVGASARSRRRVH